MSKQWESLRSTLRWICVVPAAVTAVLGAVAVAWLLAASDVRVSGSTTVALAVAGLGCLLVIAVAFLHAERVIGVSDGALTAARTVLLQGQAELQGLLEELRQGARPALGPPPAAAAEPGDRMAALFNAAYHAQHAAKAALVQASALSPVTAPGAQVEVFVNLARRLQSLVHRTIQLLDDLENQVEDPDLLKGLFQADHLVTRIRRHAENLAVLGGADSRRQWSTPQAMTEVLRSAIAEVEQYSRVKLVPPVEGTVQGHAVADVVHLIAELIENATVFSPPHTLVLLRAQAVTAGLAIEVEDRGLGLSREDQQRLNSLLVDPQRVDVGALLRDGRLGAYVVSVLARRHGMTVQLQTNIFGGTQAVIVLPHKLLGSTTAPGSEAQIDPLGRPPVQVTWRYPASAEAAQLPRRAAAAPPAAALPAVANTATINRSAQSTAVPEPLRPNGDGDEVTPQSTVVAADSIASGPGDRGARPPLPRRTSQAHLGPELRRAGSPQWEEPTGEHDPRLMAAFREGFRQAGTSNDEDDGG